MRKENTPRAEQQASVLFWVSKRCPDFRGPWEGTKQTPVTVFFCNWLPYTSAPWGWCHGCNTRLIVSSLPRSFSDNINNIGACSLRLYHTSSWIAPGACGLSGHDGARVWASVEKEK
jgi:hypothetical protein